MTNQEIRILLIEDDVTLQNRLRIFLQNNGYSVATAHTGGEALRLFHQQSFDLVLLDVMLPDQDGFAFCAELRQQSDVPIVILSALTQPDDIVCGFQVGADDYICKPIIFREVEVRIQAILRRANWSNKERKPRSLRSGEIFLGEKSHQVTVRGHVIDLTPIEYRLLQCLMKVPNQPVSKSQLILSVWEYDLVGGTNLIEVAVHRLRKKIEKDPSDPFYLVTVPKVGYKFNTQPLPKRDQAMVKTPMVR